MFGELLQQFRVGAGLSRIELARLADIDASYLFRLETGDRTPSRGIIATLIDVLQLDQATAERWLSAAGYQPLPLTGAVRTRGLAGSSSRALPAARKPVRTRGAVTRPPAVRAEWLEAAGLNEVTAARLMGLLERSDTAVRQDVALTLSSAMARVIAELDSPVRYAVIPAAGKNERLLATHVLQRLLLDAVAEAAVCGISRFVFILPAGVRETVALPIEKTLALSIVPHLTLEVREQPEPAGLGDAILRAEDLIRDENFAVMLPDDVLRDKGKRVRPPNLAHMIQASAGLAGAALVAVTRISKSKMSRSGVVSWEDEELREGVRKVSRLAEKPEPSHPILESDGSLRGVVGRYIIPCRVLASLKKIKQKKKPPVLELTEGLDAYRAEGNAVYAFEVDAANRDDVGALLSTAGEILGRGTD